MAKCENENCNNEVVKKNGKKVRRFCSPVCANSFRRGKPGHTRSAEVQKKINQTCKEKYGVENPYQSEEVKEKIKRTNLERLGVEYTAQSNEVQDKRKINWRITYRSNYFNKLLSSDRLQDLVEPLFTLKEYNGVTKQRYNFKCKKCGNIFEDTIDNGHVPICRVCFPYLICYSSHYEDEIVNWLGEFDIQQIVRHDRQVVYPKELDIYLPEYKLAIEFNGLVWHSEISGKKDRKYHLDKTNGCEEKGIQLLHIFEDEWVQKQEIVKSIIKSKLGLITNRIYARDTEVKSVLSIDARQFLFDNHLQTVVNCNHYFGLYYQDAIVYLIGISKPRFNKDYQFELVRSCPKINTNVVGGFSKLIKHAVKALSISTMISYVDRRYFTGKGYKDWKLINSTSPNYYYITNNYTERESRVKYQRHKLETLFSTTYDKNLTEWEIMQLAGFDRVYDCGNLVFEFKNE